MKNNIARTFHKVGLKFKKHSPEILMVAGIAGTVASAVMACKATTKLNTILEESKDNIDKIHKYVETEGFSEKYTEEDSKKDLTIVYTQTGVKLAKLYGPAVILGAISIGAIINGHNILHKRNLALAAAYKAVDKGFKDYRSRVVERFGKGLDRELKYNIKAKDIEETVTNDDGTESTVNKTVNTVTGRDISEYAKFYDDGCTGWCKDPEHNLMFLRRQQDYANERLQSKGYLFLNEVYDMLGIPRTGAGQVVGWIYNEKNPTGENYVDFGIYDIYNEKARDFVNGYERSILLDFNVDGYILDEF
jgi:hypothetical protein